MVFRFLDKRTSVQVHFLQGMPELYFVISDWFVVDDWICPI